MDDGGHMENIVNPAAQLLALVKAFRAQHFDQTALNAIASVFKIDPGHSIAISHQIIGVADLCQIAQLATEKHIFGNKDIYLAPFVKLETIIYNINLNAPWKGYLGKLNETLVTELTFADHFLENAINVSRTEKSLAAAGLVAKLDELLESCLNSDLAPEIQDLFAKHLQKLKAALVNYRIYGDEALQQILDEAVGSIHRHSVEIKAQSEKGKEFISCVFEAIGKMNDLVSANESLTKIAGAIVYFLPHLH
ncbi:hypothetical protein C4J96_4538 [Pseudomonas orientalis]|uniref:hypothetical protein n=1 Tax=Pseudomonas orientalis TaxID=76758 RepID=UPI000F566BB4|nr:hypothetical protein [Pseudomonas orientalis]AZE96616.1 hypothetical protein C4J96_4538 [Pseudomonas orientalis]